MVEKSARKSRGEMSGNFTVLESVVILVVVVLMTEASS